MPLNEHVYCVAITFKMTEQVEGRICIKFCIKHKHSCEETLDDSEAAATGNWWLAVSPWHASHLVQSCLAKHQTIQVSQLLYSPDLASCNFWPFPKLKSPLKEKRFQTIDEIQENTMGQLLAIGRTLWGPKVPTLKGTEVSLSHIQCFLYLLQWVSLFFMWHGWIPSGKTLYMWRLDYSKISINNYVECIISSY